MKTFKRFRTLKELKAECKLRRWKIDTRRHDKDGHDHVRFEFKIFQEPLQPAAGFVLFNTFNGRFFGELSNGEKFDGSNSTHEDCHWFQSLLAVVYTNGEPYRWILTARRSNGEVVYLVKNPSEGTRMVPNAASIADTFATLWGARQRIPKLSAAWKGLTDWKAMRVGGAS